MSLKKSPHLITLKDILNTNQKRYLFLCIEDLVANGLVLSRFPGEESKPSRQDITQFILAWFKYIGISADECRDWMIEYCFDVLSVLSSSSPSQIRHSTKSNIKYIFRSDVTFDCGCENNPFKATCEQNCPVYDEMSVKYKERLEREANRTYEVVKVEPPKIFQPILKRDEYKDQFEKAIEFIHHSIKEGVARKEIVKLLNEREFKTRTGKKWTYSVLQRELEKHLNRDIYKDQFEKAIEFIHNSIKEGVAKKEIVNLLNEREFRTRTGKKWRYATLQVELNKHKNKLAE